MRLLLSAIPFIFLSGLLAAQTRPKNGSIGVADEKQSQRASAPEVRSAVASISRTINTGPTASIDLGKATVSQTIKVVVDLQNNTSEEIRFDEIAASCSCSEISPDSGRLAPGESLDLKMTLSTVDLPNSLRGGGLFEFKRRGVTCCVLQFSYDLAGYVGIPAGVIVSEIHPTRNDEALSFIVPILISGDVHLNDIQFSVDGIEGDFQYEIDELNERLVGKVATVVDPAKTTLYGSLIMKNLKSGRVKTTPMMFQRRDLMRVYPGLLRFTEGETEGTHVGVCYVKPDRSIITAEAKLAVEANVDDLNGSIETTASTLANGVFKVTITVTDREEPLGKTNSKRLGELEGEARTLRMRLIYDETAVTSNLTFRVQET